MTPTALLAETLVPFLNATIRIPDGWSNAPDASYVFYAFTERPTDRVALAVAKIPKNDATLESMKKMRAVKSKSQLVHVQRSIPIAGREVSEEWLETNSLIWLIQSIGDDPYLHPVRNQIITIIQETSKNHEN